MAKINPEIVAKAARTLFGTGHSEALVFFTLKAGNCSTSEWITVTSSNEPSEALKLIAAQPEGFDKLVSKNLEAFSAPNDSGLPTRPGARGTPDDYSMFWPVTEETQYLLRKRDCNRNAVWSNIIGGRGALNADKAKAADVFEVRDPLSGTGKDVRFKTDYVFAAHWYYGPRKGVPMQVPLTSLAIWLHRTDDLPNTTTIDDLVASTIKRLHITEAERYLIFPRDFDNQFPFLLKPEDFVSDWSLAKYFKTLCLPSKSLRLQSSPIVAEKFLNTTKKDWDFTAHMLGFKRMDGFMEPLDTAKQIIFSGERNILLIGPPRTGKSFLALQLAADYLGVGVDNLQSDKRFQRIQFHQGWSYGDFIRKITPKPSGTSLLFERTNGTFFQHCLDHPKGKSVFVIEEFNRANLANVFGEVFQVIETSYRELPITLPGTISATEPKNLVVPQDLLLIATANDVDRSTLPLDFAMLSRFSVIPIAPDHSISFKVLCEQKWQPATAERFVALIRELETISEYPIGHANFFKIGPPDKVRWWYFTKLRPILSHYLTKHRNEDLERADALVDSWQT